jgi:hypothetical protein
VQRVKLTRTTVDRLQATDKEQIVFDAELRGFGIRVTPNGAKSYLIQYRNSEGRSRKLTLGAYARITADEARKLARDALGRVARGEDPAEQRKETREAATLAQLAAYYFDTYAPQRRRIDCRIQHSLRIAGIGSSSSSPLLAPARSPQSRSRTSGSYC